MREKNDTLVSIIIVNWNGKEFLDRCLNSIYAFEKKISFEIILVDNGSSDSSREMVIEKYPDTIWIQNEENEGFGKANNLGIHLAKSEFLLLINNDTLLVENDMILGLLRYLQDNKRVGAVGPKLLNQDRSIQWSIYSFPSVFTELYDALMLSRIFPLNKRLGKFRLKFSDLSTPVNVDWLSGACILLRKSILNVVGEFDERFFMYFEETDLCKRIKLNGWEIHYLPHYSLIHYGGGSTGGLSYFNIEKSMESMKIFFVKYYGVNKYRLAMTIRFLGTIQQYAICSILRIFLRNPQLIKHYKWNKFQLKWFLNQR